MKEVNPLLSAKAGYFRYKAQSLRGLPSYRFCQMIKLSVSVMLHGTIRSDNSWRNTSLQCWNNVVTMSTMLEQCWNNVAAMLQRCVALKMKSSLQIVPCNITLSSVDANMVTQCCNKQQKMISSSNCVTWKNSRQEHGFLVLNTGKEGLWNSD